MENLNKKQLELGRREMEHRFIDMVQNGYSDEQINKELKMPTQEIKMLHHKHQI